MNKSITEVPGLIPEVGIDQMKDTAAGPEGDFHRKTPHFPMSCFSIFYSFLPFSNLLRATAVCTALLAAACTPVKEVEFEPAVSDAERISKTEFIEQQDSIGLLPDGSVEISTVEDLYGTDTQEVVVESRQDAATDWDDLLQYAVIYFDFDSYELSDQTKDILKHHAEFMISHPDINLRIEGHADQRGSSGYNLALGKKRANAVKEILVVNGAPPDDITLISYGEERPVVDGDTESAYRKNRRTELIYR